MPQIKRGKGYSHWNPSNPDAKVSNKLVGVPRLLRTRKGAERCIVQWNAVPNGRQSYRTSYFGEEEYDTEIKNDGRKKEDLEIVEIRIKIKGPGEPYWSDLEDETTTSKATLVK
jgi:hypothetical protein